MTLCACASTSREPIAFDTSLQEDFKKADDIQLGKVDPAERDELRRRLHARLRKEGDDYFATALSALPLMDQVSVVNIMGFQNPSDYDKFPKTRYVLGSAPKI
jgi:hypothetical protein